MKKFLAVYTGTPESRGAHGWDRLSDEERGALERKGIEAWTNWMNENAAIISDTGGPLGKTKNASPNGLSDTKNNLCGYVIIQAETHEAAIKLFDNHPHFSIFPGDAVEVMECLPIPGQS
ncbi:MAG: hypothetical protein HWE39_00675 [Oceanospirillaceae bacterium]|nr:hypothetical protein [Oceanospirillaceae bacterium]